MNVSRMRYLCGIVHRTGLAGRRQPEGTVDLRRFRRGFGYRNGGLRRYRPCEHWGAAGLTGYSIVTAPYSRIVAAPEPGSNHAVSQ